ncbi:MAG TPA: hypothetical protein VM425_12115 [Myxococcota bacterium]|nr:hypothetical protein [Myxococcota bacterium]
MKRADTIALAVNAVRLLCGSHLLLADLAQGLDTSERATSNLLADLRAVGLPLRADGGRYWLHRGEASAWLTSPWMVGQECQTATVESEAKS